MLNNELGTGLCSLALPRNGSQSHMQSYAHLTLILMVRLSITSVHWHSIMYTTYSAHKLLMGPFILRNIGSVVRSNISFVLLIRFEKWYSRISRAHEFLIFGQALRKHDLNMEHSINILLTIRVLAFRFRVSLPPDKIGRW